MPLYEFECETCKARVEVIQKFKDLPPICQNCSNGAEGLIVEMKKVLSSGTSFILKGKGWYRDGYSK